MRRPRCSAEPARSRYTPAARSSLCFQKQGAVPKNAISSERLIRHSRHLSPLLDPIFHWLGRVLEPLGSALAAVGAFFGAIIDFLFGRIPAIHLPFDTPDWVWTTAKIALFDHGTGPEAIRSAAQQTPTNPTGSKRPP